MEMIDASRDANVQRIDMTRDADVAYWCRLFDVDHAQLRRAVQQVGPQAVAVLRFLRKTGASSAEMPSAPSGAPHAVAD